MAIIPWLATLSARIHVALTATPEGSPRLLLLSSFYNGRNQGTERLDNLPEGAFDFLLPGVCHQFGSNKLLQKLKKIKK